MHKSSNPSVQQTQSHNDIAKMFIVRLKKKRYQFKINPTIIILCTNYLYYAVKKLKEFLRFKDHESQTRIF